MSVAPARRAALSVLGRVRRDGAFSGPVLAAELSKASLTPADAGLATRLAYGTLSAEGVLDEVLDRFVNGRIEPQIRDVLRLAAFELLFGRAPAYAVVDQAVVIARGVRSQAAGLVNAVVRRVAESADTFPWGDPAHDLDALARSTAHPRWIVDLAIASLGAEAAREMLACGLEPAPSFVRLDPFAQPQQSTLEMLAGADPSRHLPDADCYLLGHPAAAFRGRPDHVGWFAMDAAAQMAPRAVDPVGGMSVLDVGAGRGNKTICLQAIASRTGGTAAITAVDVHEGKVAALRARLAEARVPGVTVQACDARDLVSCFGGADFDGVLVDAPCSGLGTLRRYPEKRWRLDPGTPRRMSELQAEMLASAAAVVRPGGAVVYSTCSVAREENAEVVQAFLSSDAGRSFNVQPLGDLIPAEWGTFRDGTGSFQSWPVSGGPDGHYVAILRRDGSKQG